jgi:hypothetical protein
MKNVKTFEGWKNDRAEMEMRKFGDERMRKAAEEKAEAGKQGCDCEDCDCENCDEENCDCGCCCSDEK